MANLKEGKNGAKILLKLVTETDLGQRIYLTLGELIYGDRTNEGHT